MIKFLSRREIYVLFDKSLSLRYNLRKPFGRDDYASPQIDRKRRIIGKR